MFYTNNIFKKFYRFLIYLTILTSAFSNLFGPYCLRVFPQYITSGIDLIFAGSIVFLFFGVVIWTLPIKKSIVFMFYCMLITCSIVCNIIHVNLFVVLIDFVFISFPFTLYYSIKYTGLDIKKCWVLLTAIVIVNLLLFVVQFILFEPGDFVAGLWPQNQTYGMMILLAVICVLGIKRKFISAFTLLLIFLSGGFRAIWPFIPIIFVLSKRHVNLVAMVKNIFIIILICSMTYSLSKYTVNYLIKVAKNDFIRISLLGLNELLEKPEMLLEIGKVKVWSNLGEIFSLNPYLMICGYGPGTFNGRAYRMFAGYNEQGGDATDPNSSPMYVLTQGNWYRTELSKKYILPYSERVFISGTLFAPKDTYISRLVELGIILSVLMCLVYVTIFKKVFKKIYNSDTLAIFVRTCILYSIFLGFFYDWWASTKIMSFLILLIFLFNVDQTGKYFPKKNIFNKWIKRNIFGFA